MSHTCFANESLVMTRSDYLSVATNSFEPEDSSYDAMLPPTSSDAWDEQEYEDDEDAEETEEIEAGVDEDIDDNEFERDGRGENEIEVEENDVWEQPPKTVAPSGSKVRHSIVQLSSCLQRCCL